MTKQLQHYVQNKLLRLPSQIQLLWNNWLHMTASY